jgi:hypothetical protein
VSVDAPPSDRADHVNSRDQAEQFPGLVDNWHRIDLVGVHDDIAARDAGSASAWPLLRPAVLPSQLACCCPAQPLDQVIFPTTTSHDQPVEVLLCGHHYRLSRATLLRVGSPIYDVTGQLIAHRV